MALESLGEIVAGMLLERKAAISVGDYCSTDDRLLYCGKCRTAKECRVEISGETITVPCLCKCGEDEWIRKEQEWQEEQRRIRIENLRVSGISDDSLRDVRFEDSDGCENIQKCQAFVDHWYEIKEQNTGLLMSGPVGTGKTYAAACIANALIDRGVPVLRKHLSPTTNTGTPPFVYSHFFNASMKSCLFSDKVAFISVTFKLSYSYINSFFIKSRA